MEYFTLARVLHVLAVVLWIGGVAMVTTVIIPAVNRLKSKEEQIKRISDRQGISEYQIKRIHQSRLDYDNVISLLSKEKEKLDDMNCGRLSLQFNWWKPVDGKFELVNIA